MTTKKFSVDIAFNGLTDQTEKFLGYLQEVCEIFNLEIVGLIPVGSGGGWPEITFRGEEANLLEFSNSFFDEEEGEDMFETYSRPDEPTIFNGAIIDPRYSTKGKTEFIDEKTKQFKEW
jgi:hypothetical protein